MGSGRGKGAGSRSGGDAVVLSCHKGVSRPFHDGVSTSSQEGDSAGSAAMTLGLQESKETTGNIGRDL